MISVVIRVLNEAKHLGALLEGIKTQRVDLPVEVVVVDSGSTDETLEIAHRHKCRVVKISKDDFSFGKSLNLGCEAAAGDFLVFVSGHCVPYDDAWLKNLVAPLRTKKASYSYGRQIGDNTTKFSEHQLLAKYFPEDPTRSQSGFFCNNANAALIKTAWLDNKFDEDLTGLEDMELAKRLMHDSHDVVYTADATVYHIHEETWLQVKRRYEREALALQHIMPGVHVRIRDFARYFTRAVLMDFSAARRSRSLIKNLREIVLFRFMQYVGTYRGNQDHRILSHAMKERYFYPDVEVTRRTPEPKRVQSSNTPPTSSRTGLEIID